MTAAYTHPNWNKPVGTDTGPNVPTNALANLRALRDGILHGKIKDWTFERSNGTGSADEPQFWLFKNTSNNIWYRVTNVWTSSKITSQAIDWSDDGGSTWAAVMAADTITYDGSLNITSQTIGSGIYVFILELIAKAKKIAADLATHIGTSGAGVHGTANMAFQANTNVNIDGGTIDGTNIGASVRCQADLTRATEDHAAFTPGSGAGVTLDWSKGSAFVTNNGVNTLTFSNVPASGRAGLMLDVTNFNNTTFPAGVDWGLGGKPSVAGAATVGLFTRDGGTTVRGTLIWRAV